MGASAGAIVAKRRFLGGKKRGPVAGNPHSGQFKPGHDSRRHPDVAERNELFKAVAEAAHDHAPKAIALLASIMESDTEPAKVRMMAAEAILDRSIGKSVNMLAVKSLDAEGDPNSQNPLLRADGSSSPVESLSDADLLAIIQQPTEQESVNDATIDGDVIDG